MNRLKTIRTNRNKLTHHNQSSFLLHSRTTIVNVVASESIPDLRMALRVVQDPFKRVPACSPFSHLPETAALNQSRNFPVP